MNILRKIFFYVFTVCYVIVCPLVILYALGYLFNPLSNQLVQTGMVYIDSNPKGAYVYLNNSRFTQRTPCELRPLLPQEYKLTLRKKGYNLWSEKIVVNSGQAISLDHVLLRPVEYSGRVLLDDKFKNLIPLDGTDYLLTADNSNLGNLSVYNWRIGKEIPVTIDEEEDSHSEIKYPVFSIYGSPFVVVRTQRNFQNKYFSFLINDDEITAVNITELLIVWPSHIYWDKDVNDIIFIQNNSNIAKIDFQDNSVNLNYLKKIKAFGSYKNNLYYVDSNYDFIKTDYAGSEKYIIDDFGRGETPGSFAGRAKGTKNKYYEITEGYFKRSAFYKIEYLKENCFAFLSGEGRLLLYDGALELLCKGVKGIKYDHNKDKLLIWTSNKIGVYDLKRDDSNQDGNISKIDWLYEKSRNIEQCFWAFDNSHVIWRDQDNVYITDIYSKTKPNKYFKIIKIKEKSAVYYTEETGDLYFIDWISEQLKAVNIIEKK